MAYNLGRIRKGDPGTIWDLGPSLSNGVRSGIPDVWDHITRNPSPQKHRCPVKDEFLEQEADLPQFIVVKQEYHWTALYGIQFDLDRINYGDQPRSRTLPVWSRSTANGIGKFDLNLK